MFPPFKFEGLKGTFIIPIMQCGENLISSARSCEDRFRPVTLSVANVKSPCLRKNNSPFVTILDYDGTLGKRNYTLR